MKKSKNKVLGTIVPHVNRRGNEKQDFAKKNKISKESKRQAFKRASEALYFNDDMEYFLTLTYKKQHQNYEKILNDIKNFAKKEKNLKYVGVVEKHKSGNYHIHLITNEVEKVSLRKGKYSCKNWKAGFSDLVHIDNFDRKFDVMKYLFKYLQKSEKIGGRWVLKSRNLIKPIQTNRNMTYKQTDIFLNNLYKSGFSIDSKEVIAYNGTTQLLIKFNNKYIWRK